MNVKKLIDLLTECDLALEVKVRIGDALVSIDDVSEVRLYGVRTENDEPISLPFGALPAELSRPRRTEGKYVELTSSSGCTW